MSGWQILGVVGILILSLLLMAVGYVMYSGLFSEINIRTGAPPMRNITIAYKFKQGPYKDCGALFTECSKLDPKLSTVGVFYDDPKKVRVSQDNCKMFLVGKFGYVLGVYTWPI